MRVSAALAIAVVVAACLAVAIHGLLAAESVSAPSAVGIITVSGGGETWSVLGYAAVAGSTTMFVEGAEIPDLGSWVSPEVIYDAVVNDTVVYSGWDLAALPTSPCIVINASMLSSIGLLCGSSLYLYGSASLPPYLFTAIPRIVVLGYPNRAPETWWGGLCGALISYRSPSLVIEYRYGYANVSSGTETSPASYLACYRSGSLELGVIARAIPSTLGFTTAPASETPIEFLPQPLAVIGGKPVTGVAIGNSTLRIVPIGITRRYIIALAISGDIARIALMNASAIALLPLPRINASGASYIYPLLEAVNGSRIELVFALLPTNETVDILLEMGSSGVREAYRTLSGTTTPLPLLIGFRAIEKASPQRLRFESFTPLATPVTQIVSSNTIVLHPPKTINASAETLSPENTVQILQTTPIVITPTSTPTTLSPATATPIGIRYLEKSVNATIVVSSNSASYPPKAAAVLYLPPIIAAATLFLILAIASYALLARGRLGTIYRY